MPLTVRHYLRKERQLTSLDARCVQNNAFLSVFNSSLSESPPLVFTHSSLSADRCTAKAQLSIPPRFPLSSLPELFEMLPKSWRLHQRGKL